MSVTLKDVAKLAGVSSATVSRVINNDPRISDKTREKVLKCVKELDYKINRIARSLKTNKTYTVGFICPELANNFFMLIAKGVEDVLRRHGYSIIVCSSNENAGEEKERFTLMAEKCVDGIIVIPATNKGLHFNRLKDLQIPVVLIDRLVDDFTSDAVLVDNINGSYSAVEYLVNQGYRRIGFIGGNMELTSARERFEGYERALRDYCIPFDNTIVKFGDFHTKSGYEMMKQLMESKEPPDYVFISNYFMHIGAVMYLMEHQSDNKVFTASFDDMEFTSMLGFGNVIVGQPVLEIGYQAAGLLLDRINHAEGIVFPQILRLKTSLKVKQ